MYAGSPGSARPLERDREQRDHHPERGASREPKTPRRPRFETSHRVSLADRTIHSGELEPSVPRLCSRYAPARWRARHSSPVAPASSARTSPRGFSTTAGTSGRSTTSRPGRCRTSSISAIATASTWSSTASCSRPSSTSSSTAATSSTTSPPRSGCGLIVEQPVRTLVTNLRGTEIVLEHCHRFGKRVLVASTSEVYGDHREETPLEETARRIYGPTTQRRWAYADSKAMDEFLALAHHVEHDLDCTIARLFNTVGPRQSGQYGMVIPTFVAHALRDETIEIHGDGDQTRCFCHVDDTVRALHGLMDDDRLGRDLQRRLDEPDLDQGARRACDRADRFASRRRSTSRTTRSTGTGSRTCCTASPRRRRSPPRSGWEPERSLEDILARRDRVRARSRRRQSR